MNRCRLPSYLNNEVSSTTLAVVRSTLEYKGKSCRKGPRWKLTALPKQRELNELPHETREPKELDKHAGSFAAAFPNRSAFCLVVISFLYRHRRQIVSASSMDNGSSYSPCVLRGNWRKFHRCSFYAATMLVRSPLWINWIWCLVSLRFTAAI